MLSDLRNPTENRHLVSVRKYVGAERILYDLLAERTEDQSISHKKMPTYEEHCEFVRLHRYRGWYLVLDGKTPVGCVYLTRQHEIGVSIFKDHQGNGYGGFAVRDIMRMWKSAGVAFNANINPKNEKSISFFKHLGFNLIQYTFQHPVMPYKKTILHIPTYKKLVA